MKSERLGDVFKRAWTTPRWFFFWMAFCCLALVGFGLAMASTFGSPFEQPPAWYRLLLVGAGLTLIAGFAAGVTGFVLSLIPAFRPGLDWVLRRRFFLLACAATLVALFYAEENWRGKMAWRHVEQEAARNGQKLSLSQVAPPAVPPDQNFAMAPIVMSSYSGTIDINGRRQIDSNVVDRLSMPLRPSPSQVNEPQEDGSWKRGTVTDLEAWQEYFRNLSAETNLFPIPAEPQSPAADVLYALSIYDPAIQELREAARRPFSRYPIEYDAQNPAAILLPYLAPLKRSAVTLQLRSAAELALGRTDDALKDFELMLRLADAVRNEPILISHLVRIAITDIALQPVWTGIIEHRWSEAQLATIQEQLGSLDFLADYQFAMRGEQGFQVGITEFLRHDRIPERFADDDNPVNLPFVLSFIIAPGGWFDLVKVRCVELNRNYYLPIADLRERTISPERARKAEAALKSGQSALIPAGYIQRMMFSSLGKAALRFASAQTSVDLARLSCALERYRLANGSLPGNLAALAPKYISSVPHDVINGQPLHYILKPDNHYTLYSIAWDETDDGGKLEGSISGSRMELPHDESGIKRGDWVWSSSKQ